MLTKLSNLYVSTQQMGWQLVGTYAQNKKQSLQIVCKLDTTH